MDKIKKILEEVLTKVNPSKEELNYINKFLKNFIAELEKKLKSTKINAEVFVGGSFAKKTLIKKDEYDIDIFVRFDEKYKGKNISELTEKAIKKMKGTGKISVIHGSRDYFRINEPSFFVEVVPVMKVKNPKNAENITDLSYFHVNYIRNKLKTEKMLEDVRLAKAFCHANKCYGAESYINGFSGYAIELLICYYGSFMNFIKAVSKIKEKEIIDIEKIYKNKYEISMNLNSAKMSSPIVIIDPTYKERNALAALSKNTLEKFQKVCKKFLENPSEKFFEDEKVNLDKIKEGAKKNKMEFVLLKAKTNKQEGDVAGSKLIKFYRHLGDEIEKSYKIGQNGFEYNGKKESRSFFVVKNIGEVLISGPKTDDNKNVISFKKKHKNTFSKNGHIYAKEKVNKSAKEFLKNWKLKNKEKIKEMGITDLEIGD